MNKLNSTRALYQSLGCENCSNYDKNKQIPMCSINFMIPVFAFVADGCKNKKPIVASP